MFENCSNYYIYIYIYVYDLTEHIELEELNGDNNAEHTVVSVETPGSKAHTAIVDFTDVADTALR